MGLDTIIKLLNDRVPKIVRGEDTSAPLSNALLGHGLLTIQGWIRLLRLLGHGLLIIWRWIRRQIKDTPIFLDHAMASMVK
jgi:hypothetical protein